MLSFQKSMTFITDTEKTNINIWAAGPVVLFSQRRTSPHYTYKMWQHRTDKATTLNYCPTVTAKVCVSACVCSCRNSVCTAVCVFLQFGWNLFGYWQTCFCFVASISGKSQQKYPNMNLCFLIICPRPSSLHQLSQPALSQMLHRDNNWHSSTKYDGKCLALAHRYLHPQAASRKRRQFKLALLFSDKS